MAITIPMPPTAPETTPTVCIIEAGSLDFGAMVAPMPKKNASAIAIITSPVSTTRRSVSPG